MPTLVIFSYPIRAHPVPNLTCQANIDALFVTRKSPKISNGSSAPLSPPLHSPLRAPSSAQCVFHRAEPWKASRKHSGSIQAICSLAAPSALTHTWFRLAWISCNSQRHRAGWLNDLVPIYVRLPNCHVNGSAWKLRCCASFSSTSPLLHHSSDSTMKHTARYSFHRHIRTSIFQYPLSSLLTLAPPLSVPIDLSSILPIFIPIVHTHRDTSLTTFHHSFTHDNPKPL